MPSFTRAKILGVASASALAAPMLDAFALAAPKGDAAADVATLNTELPFARGAVKAYGDATATSILNPAALETVKGFATDHQAHVDAIVAAVTQAGGTASADLSPPVDIASLKVEADILGALYTLERAVAAAYLAAIGELKDRNLARSTGAMLGVVTTHVALLGEALRRGQAYPTSFVTS
jgi:hypothetical protein